MDKNQPNPAQQAPVVERGLYGWKYTDSYGTLRQVLDSDKGHGASTARAMCEDFAARELTAAQGVEHGEDAPQFPLPGAEPKWSEDIGCVIHELRAGRPELALKRALHIQSLADAAQENQ